ncbi:MAG TPA: DUF6527 family protein [Bryobacteraceae bacterium]|nr:DUF6527 family protein [Bryobacteraceae bacterium]
MKQGIVLKHEFVEFIPGELKEGTIYISIRFGTASHLCCCGCGNKVVTPLRPTDWKLIFDGKTVSLDPSIGNWSFACRSHYWIRNNRVRWAAQWSPEEIAAGRAHDRFAKDRYFDTADTATDGALKKAPVTVETAKAGPRWWLRIKKWWQRS